MLSQSKCCRLALARHSRADNRARSTRDGRFAPDLDRSGPELCHYHVANSSESSALIGEPVSSQRSGIAVANA